MADQMKPTPRSTILGLFSDVVNLPLEYMSSPERTQQMQGAAQFLYGTGIPKTLERMSYGDSLFTGSGMTLRPREETINAAMNVAPFVPAVAKVLPKIVRATEGMPVGMSIKPINLNKGIYKPELTMEEMLKVKDIPTVDRVRQSIDLVGEKEFEKMVNAQYKKYKPSDVDQEAMLVESVTLNILGKAQRSPYPQQAALDLAQQRAALPIEQGGLGLPANNTPEMRAAAMGFDVSNPQYHATDVDFASINPSSRGKMGAGIYTSPDVQYAEKYAALENRRVLPLVSKGYYADADKRSAIFDKVREEVYANNPNVTSRELHDLVAEEMQNRGYSGFDVDKERLTFNPSDLRSRFAAFDPFRRDVATATAMGVAAPDLLAQPVDQYQIPQDTTPMYTDPFANTIGSSIR